MQKLVHRLSDPRDPSYPFSDTYICSKCNERLQLTDTHCSICNLGIDGMVKVSKPRKISNTLPNTTLNDAPKEIDITNINAFKDNEPENVSLSTNEITIDKIEIPINGTFKEIFYLMLLLFLILFIIIGYDINNTIIKALIE